MSIETLIRSAPGAFEPGRVTERRAFTLWDAQFLEVLIHQSQEVSGRRVVFVAILRSRWVWRRRPGCTGSMATAPCPSSPIWAVLTPVGTPGYRRAG